MTMAIQILNVKPDPSTSIGALEVEFFGPSREPHTAWLRPDRGGYEVTAWTLDELVIEQGWTRDDEAAVTSALEAEVTMSVVVCEDEDVLLDEVWFDLTEPEPLPRSGLERLLADLDLGIAPEVLAGTAAGKFRIALASA